MKRTVNEEPTGKVVKKTITEAEFKNLAIRKLLAFLTTATIGVQIDLFPFCFDLRAMFTLLRLTNKDVIDNADLDPPKKRSVVANLRHLVRYHCGAANINDSIDFDDFVQLFDLYRRTLTGSVAVVNFGAPVANVQYSLFIRCDANATLTQKDDNYLNSTKKYDTKDRVVNTITPGEFMRIARTTEVPRDHPFIATFRYEKSMSGDMDVISACKGAEVGLSFTHCHLIFIPTNEIAACTLNINDNNVDSPITDFTRPCISFTSGVSKLIGINSSGDKVDLSLTLRITHHEVLFSGPIFNIPNMFCMSIPLAWTMLKLVRAGCSIDELLAVASCCMPRNI